MRSLAWLSALTLASLCVPTPAAAFGLRMHLYIADQVFNDASDCKIALPNDGSEELPQRLCNALKASDSRGYFLAGALGPDIFPDLLIGQNFIHPGTDKGRKAADWLEIMIAEAKTDAEIAFVYGVMVHASSDIFAHSYVNNYSGGVFELLRNSSKDIELRHFELEKYIDQRLDYGVDLDSLKVPTELLVRSMVRASYVPGQIEIDEATLAADLRQPGKTLATILAEKVKSTAPAAHMTAMWTALLISENAALTAPCNQIRATRRMAAAFRAYVQAERYAREEGPIPDVVVPPVNRCKWDENDDTLESAEADLEAALEGSVNGRTGAAFSSRKEWWNELPRDRRRPLRRAYETYENTVTDWKRMTAIGVMAPEWKEDVDMAVRAYMNASLEAGKIVVGNSEPYPPALHQQKSSVWPYQKWQTCYLPVIRGAPLAAAQATCNRLTNLETDIGLGEAAIHAALGSHRNLVFRYLDAKQWLDRVSTKVFISATKLIAPNLGKLIDHIHEPKRIDRGDLNHTFRSARNGQLTFKCVADWIDTDLGMLPGQTSGHREDSDCQEHVAADSKSFFDPAKFMPAVHAITLSKLALLDQKGIRNVAATYKADGTKIQMSDITHYSLILDTARSLDGSYQWQGYSMPMARRTGSAAQKENEAAGYPVPPQKGGLVISSDDKIKQRFGFPYYQSNALRKQVFSQLFKQPFEGQILLRQEFNAVNYPFWPCTSDPFRPRSDGTRRTICWTTEDAK